MTHRFLLFLFLSLAHPWAAAQKKIDLQTRPKAFTTEGLANIQDRLDALNKVSTIQVVFRTAMFPLAGKAELKVDPALLNGKTAEEVGEIMAKSFDTMVDYPDFTIKYKASDAATKTVFNKLPGSKNTVLVNIVVGLRLIGLADPYIRKSYSHLTAFAGDDVPKAFADKLKAFCDTPGTTAAFHDETFHGNDVFLGDIVNFFYQELSPLAVTYGDPVDIDFDDNAFAQCSPYSSYKETKPISGLPWKCIPADGTAVSIAVKIGPSGAPVNFKLSNPTDFTLRSPVPDGNSKLYISSTKKNATTSVIPVLSGKEIAIQSLSVVAYEKRKLKVAIVYIEEENDDVQAVAEKTGNLDPKKAVVTSGKNGFLDTTPGGDDQVVTDPVTKQQSIVAGQDSICNTEAKRRNTKFAIGMDRNELEQKMNDFYRKYMMEWEVDKAEYTKAINYDLNNDRYLDIGGYNNGKFVKHPEEELIHKNAKIAGPGITHYLFVVPAYDNSDPDDYLFGRTTGDLKSALLFASEMQRHKDEKNQSAEMKDYLYTTSAHELGHAAFDFQHIVPPDGNNLMKKGHPFLDRCRLRKFQWDLIHK